MKNAFKYKPKKPDPGQRRVYMLSADMILRVHAFGYETGCQSEAEAVRVLLNNALDARTALAKGGQTSNDSSSTGATIRK